MNWSDFIEFYLTLWIISIPLTILLISSVIHWIKELYDYIKHYERVKYISIEINRMDLISQKNLSIQNNDKIEKSEKESKMLKAQLSDPNESLLGSYLYTNVKKIIR
jgi:predicted PurR-regulated permease PerM